MLFALRQRQMRPLRTWRHEDAYLCQLKCDGDDDAVPVCACVCELRVCASNRAPREGAGAAFIAGEAPGGGDGSNTPSMWGGYVFICALSVNV